MITYDLLISMRDHEAGTPEYTAIQKKIITQAITLNYDHGFIFYSESEFLYPYPKNKTIAAVDIINLFALLEQTRITQLAFNHMEFTSDSLSALAKGLKSNRTITHVNIMTALKTGYSGALHVDLTSIENLADALKTNNTICTLNLSCNHIATQSAIAFARALTTNHTLTYLDLSSNVITDAILTELILIFQSNKTLSYLDISGNGLDVIKCILPFITKIDSNLRLVFGEYNTQDADIDQLISFIENINDRFLPSLILTQFTPVSHQARVRFEQAMIQHIESIQYRAAIVQNALQPLLPNVITDLINRYDTNLLPSRTSLSPSSSSLSYGSKNTHAAPHQQKMEDSPKLKGPKK